MFYSAQSNKAFTLIELMVVIAIMGILSGIAIPTYLRNLPSYNLKKSSSELCANIRKARSMAIKMNRAITVSFSAERGRYVIDQNRTVVIERNVSYGANSGVPAVKGGTPPANGISFSGSVLTFDSRGFPANLITETAVYLKNTKNESHAVSVTPAGNIILKKWSGSSWQ